MSYQRKKPTIEDLIVDLCDMNQRFRSSRYSMDYDEREDSGIMRPRDYRFIEGIYKLVAPHNKKTISTEQAKVCIEILGRYTKHIMEHCRYSEDQIKDALKNPIYNNTPYKSLYIPREVRYLGNGSLAFRSKFNEELIESFRKIEGSYFCQWKREYKITVVPIKNEKDLDIVMSIIKIYKFEFDDEVLQFLTNCSNTSKSDLGAEIIEDKIHLEFGDIELNIPVDLMKIRDNDVGTE